MELDIFYEEIKVLGKNTLYITIPEKLVKFTGLQKGDRIKVIIKKAQETP